MLSWVEHDIFNNFGASVLLSRASNVAMKSKIPNGKMKFFIFWAILSGI